jgi:hypothetical protein
LPAFSVKTFQPETYVNKIGRSVAAVAALFGVMGGSAFAASEKEMPKVFRDAPAQKGQWRMEILKFDSGQGGEATGRMPQSVTMCMDSLMEMAKKAEQRQGADSCRGKLIENKDDRAVYETTCKGGGVYHSTITREGPHTFLIEAGGENPEGLFAMTSRYTYDGPCSANGGQPAFRFGKDSEVCKAMKSQMSRLDPNTACAGSKGAARQSCEQQMAQSLAQLKGMCE